MATHSSDMTYVYTHNPYDPLNPVTVRYEADVSPTQSSLLNCDDGCRCQGKCATCRLEAQRGKAHHQQYYVDSGSYPQFVQSHSFAYVQADAFPAYFDQSYGVNPSSDSTPSLTSSASSLSSSSLQTMPLVPSTRSPSCVLRQDIVGHCSFVPFPQDTLQTHSLRRKAPYPRPVGVVQMFFGQVPFNITDAQILYVFQKIAGSDVLFIERVIQNDSQRGCIQLFIRSEVVEVVQNAIHQRVLFDIGGFWFAETDAEMDLLREHCDNRELSRHRGLPSNCVVLEPAKSTFALTVALRNMRRNKRLMQRMSAGGSLSNDSYANLANTAEEE